jgi:hypothetical protein
MVDSNSLWLDATVVNTSLVTLIIPFTTAATVDYCIHILDSSKQKKLLDLHNPDHDRWHNYQQHWL